MSKRLFIGWMIAIVLDLHVLTAFGA